MRTVLYVMSAVLVSAPLYAQQVAPEKKIEDAAREAVAAYATAWNAGDARGLADLYTNYADYTGFGSVMTRGREEIFNRYAALLNGSYRGTQLAMALSSLRLVGTDVAVVDGTLDLGGNAADPAAKASKGMFIAIMTREAGDWKFTTFWSKRLLSVDQEP
jgi:uncharacterized protein (TIGR02246 family)